MRRVRKDGERRRERGDEEEEGGTNISEVCVIVK